MATLRFVLALALASFAWLQLPVAQASGLLFGPQFYERGSGKPVVETTPFTAEWPDLEYALTLVNGPDDAEGNPTTRVSSAEVYLNGALVIGPHNLSQREEYVVVPVQLQFANELTVELRGKPGARVAIEIALARNYPPVADAGADQSAYVSDTAALDGTASSDINGDPLNFHWQWLNLPASSVASLIGADTPTPTFTIDIPGTYEAELIVSDGEFDSNPDTVLISTLNSPPVADAGDDQTLYVGDSAQLDGFDSYDADGDILTFAWSLPVRPLDSLAELAGADTATPSFDVDKPGHYRAELVVNDGEYDSDPDSIVVTTRNSQPVANAGPDTTAHVGDTVTLDGSDSFDADGDPLSYGWSILGRPGDSQSQLEDPSAVQPRFLADVVGDYITQLIVDDGELLSEPDTVRVTVTDPPPNQPPVITSAPDTTVVLQQPWQYLVVAADPEGSSLEYLLSIAPTGMQIDAQTGAITWTPEAVGSYSVQVRVRDDRDGEATQSFTLTVTDPNGPSLPPDPVTVAPPLDPTVFTPFDQSTEFLYKGSNPVQRDMTPGTIDARRAAVLRGRVLSRDDQPLPGVIVAVKDHPEYGYTLSRADGYFDLAVNGGGLVTLNYTMSGHLPAQRQMQVPWNEYTLAEDVVLIELDQQVNAIDLSDTTRAYQVAQGSVSADVDGERQATVLFPKGTQATMMLPDGSTQPLSTLNVRATEYTVGDNGPQAMPGPLPPTSGYTYAVELSADEALQAGAVRVDFNQPLPVYVDNFLDFPVGEVVPAGWYDFERSAWIPSDNGRIVAITEIINGKAELDVDGDGIADDVIKLSSHGITEAEQIQLAELYAPGKSFWRVPISHFTPWDCNWPYGPPDDAEPPPDEEPKSEEDEEPEDPCEEQGCVIQAETQVLGENFPVAGTPFHLHYRSNRVPGRKTGYSLEIPVSDASVSPSLKRINLTIEVAGRKFDANYAPNPSQTYTFDWDGLDVYGRKVPGMAVAHITVGHAYKSVYYAAEEDFERSFSLGGRSDELGFNLIGQRESQPIVITQQWRKRLSAYWNSAAALGGVSLDVHHAYDPESRTLYLGDGSSRDGRAGWKAGSVVKTVSGRAGSGSYGGDGGLAINARLNRPTNVDWDSAGNMYIGDTGNCRIRRIDTEGIITTVVGTGVCGWSGDGGPATEATIYGSGVAVGPDDSLYVYGGLTIRKVNKEGIISHFAGIDEPGYSGDGGMATSASFFRITDVNVAKDGSVFVVDSGNSRVRRIAPSGVVTTFAGNGEREYSGDGWPATRAGLYYPTSLELDADDNLYITDGGYDGARIRRVGADGIITTIAGTGKNGFSGDGGPAIAAEFDYPGDLAVAKDGSIYIVDHQNYRIRRIGPDGVISTVVGNGLDGYTKDGELAVNVKGYPTDIAVGPEGDLYVLYIYQNLIRRIVPVFPGVDNTDLSVPSVDGSELYIFDSTGRHLETRETLTGSVRYSFTYNEENLLVGVTDSDGNLTTIERLSDGTPTAIITPYGQRTAIGLDPNGWLATLTNPAGETHRMEYTADGLLTRYVKPRGENFDYTYSYDALGRLTHDRDPAGGGWDLVRTENDEGHAVSLTSMEGRTSFFETKTIGTGDFERSVTLADGTISTSLEKTNGETISSHVDGTVVVQRLGPDPRFGMQAPFSEFLEITTPGGLVSTTEKARWATLSDPDDPLSLLTETEAITQNGRSTTKIYRASNRTLTATSAEGRSRSIVFDEKGRITRTQLGDLFPVAYAYDDQGRLHTITEGEAGEARASTIEYGTDGFVESLTDTEMRQSTYETDEVGRVLEQQLPDGRVVGLSYDFNGNLTGVTPPGRPVHEFAYTPVDLQDAYAPPIVPGVAEPATLYSYNRDKEVTLIDRPDGKVVDFVYNLKGQLTTVTTEEGARKYSYDPITQQLADITMPDGGSLSFTYDGHLLLNEAWAGDISGSISRGYNNDFNLHSLTVNGSDSVEFAYDDDELLVQAGDLILRRNTLNGLLDDTVIGVVADSWTYNGFGEIENYEAQAGGSPVYQAEFTRDALGRIVEKREIVGGVSATYAYTYDLAGRLEEVYENSVLAREYGYDNNGNRTHLNGNLIATYDDQDRLNTYGVASYSFNANGDLESKTENGVTTNYEYDAFGNLRSVVLPGGSSIEYIVDGRGRRIGKKIDDVLRQGFLYRDQLNPIAELNAAGDVVARYVYADKINVPSYMVKDGRTYRIVSDHLGSPRLVVDILDGSIIQALQYDEWGRVIFDTNPGFQPFGFAGGMYDLHTGLVKHGARDYDPVTGRWAAKDLMRFHAGDTLLYGYVHSDPVNFIDITGEAEICTRALEGVGFQFESLNHTNIWYGDGDNVGFFDGASPQIRPDHGHSKDEYECSSRQYSDEEVRDAVEKLRPSWEGTYNFKAGRNCQSFVKDVKDIVDPPRKSSRGSRR